MKLVRSGFNATVATKELSEPVGLGDQAPKPIILYWAEAVNANEKRTSVNNVFLIT
jgi:hypothetical protein